VQRGGGDVSTDLDRARVLVTGARGFIGVHLVARLLELGAEVHGTSRSAQPDGGGGMRWHTCDLGSSGAVRRLFAELRPDFAVHLSSLADGRRDRELVLATFESETVATVNVLTAASEAGIRRLILPGSLEEPEGASVPSSPYAAAKAASRLYARMFHALYGLPVVMTRIFMTYGPGQPEWKLVPSVVRTFLSGRAPEIASPARAVDWIYVADLVAGLLRVLTAPGLEGQSVDLGSGELTNVAEIVALLRQLIAPGIEPRFGQSPRVNERVCRADATETLRLTGWRPVIGLHEGLRLTVDALRRKIPTPTK
jgi:UDP-glucose 4-epimerase